MAMKLSLLVQMVDRMSAPARRASQSARQMTDSVRRIATGANAASRPIDRLGERAGALTAKLRQAGAAAMRFSGRVGMKAVEKSALGAANAVGFAVGKIARFGIEVARGAALAGTAVAGFSLFNIFRIGSQFEQFEVTLRTVIGSADGARRAMAWVQQFAEQTPYELAEVMSSYVRLRTYGIDPLDGSLRSAGDAAAAMGRPLEAAVEALADAMTGEMERLKSFGVTASQAGNKVTLTYRKQGQEITRTARKGEELRRAVTGIWDELFGGAMEDQSKTFVGLFNNLRDKWTGFQKAIADAGIFALVKGKLQQLLEWVNKLAADGTLKRWAEDISQRMEDAVAWATKLAKDTKWDKVARDVKLIAVAAGEVVAQLARMVELANKLEIVNPLRGGLPGAIYRRVFGENAPDTNQRAAPTSSPYVPLHEMGRGAFPWPGQRGKRPAPSVGSGRPSAVNVTGQAELTVKLADGLSGRVTKLKAPGDVHWKVKTGRTMGGPA